ncbi:MAG: hypothetical protein K2J71_05565 [Oscillospiraceae bacterium]|nr:hypothetical protein [Oscillospiraceae bacterium]
MTALIEKLKGIPELKFDENAEMNEILTSIDEFVKKKKIVFVYGKGRRKTAVQRIFEQLTECAERKTKYDSYNSIFNGRELLHERVQQPRIFMI